MKLCRRVGLLAAMVLALLVVDVSSATAQGPGCYGGGWWGGAAYPFGSYFPNGGTYYVPPYFSLFPPVYYSYPVPRPYGYSPFAYPIGSPTPEVQIEAVGAKMMVNPHAPETATPSTDQTAGGPRTILNPFVVGTVAAQ